MDAMVERIERLERSVRRFRWAGSAVACLAVVGLVMGQKVESNNKPKVIEVDKIVANKVVAESYGLMINGELRGSWMADAGDNQPALTMFRKSKAGAPSNGPILYLGAGLDDASIIMHMPNGYKSFWGCTKDGFVTISLLSKGEKSIGGNWGGSPSLGSNLLLYDKEGRPRAVLGQVDGDSESSLVLFDKRGQAVFKAP